jgi:hypothetical protein
MILDDWCERVGESEVMLGGENGRHQCGSGKELLSSDVGVLLSQEKVHAEKAPAWT